MDKQRVAAELVKLAREINAGGSNLDALDLDIARAARFLKKGNIGDAMDAVDRANKTATKLRAERMAAIDALQKYDQDVGRALFWVRDMLDDVLGKDNVQRLLTRAVINGNKTLKTLYL